MVVCTVAETVDLRVEWMVAEKAVGKVERWAA